MDIPAWLMSAAAFLIGAAVAGGVAFWWFGRKLRAALAQQERLDKARQFTAQQASQARKQIEVLQQDIAVLRQAHAKRGLRSESMPATVSPGENSGDGAADQGPKKLPPDGFADTQVLSPRR